MSFAPLSLILDRLTLAEYHEQEEIFKLRLGHLKKVGPVLNLQPRFTRRFFVCLFLNMICLVEYIIDSLIKLIFAHSHCTQKPDIHMFKWGFFVKKEKRKGCFYARSHLRNLIRVSKSFVFCMRLIGHLYLLSPLAWAEPLFFLRGSPQG